MKQYIDVAQDISGNALAGATCTVRTYPGGSLASIFSDNGLTPIGTSIVTADVTGQFSFFVADGDYTLQLSFNGSIYKTQTPVSIFDGAAQVTFADSGSANAYATTNSALEKALRVGLRAFFNAAHTNTGASTFQYNTLAVKSIVSPGGFPLGAGAIQATGIYALEYDGTNWQLISEPGVAPFYVTIPAETTAGVSIVNFSYPPMTVDRYVANTTPGTTPTQVGFNAAIKVAQVAGGTVTYGATAPYLTTAPINATFGTTANQFGVLIKNTSGVGQDTPFPSGAQLMSIIAQHTGSAVFDCTGNDSIRFEDVTIGTDTTTFPQTGVLWARCATAGTNSQTNSMYGCRIIGFFSVAPFYNYGSEDSALMNCHFQNRSSGTGTKTRVYTGQNVSNIASSFQTIRSNASPVSCIDHNSFACIDYNWAGTATSDCIYLDQVGDFKSYGGWALNASSTAAGRAIVFIDQSAAGSSKISIDGLTLENASFVQQYMLAFSNNVPASPSSGIWVTNCISVVSTKSIIALAGAGVVDTLYVSGLTETVTKGISIPGTLQNSVIITSTTLSIGTSANNVLIGSSESWTITTRSKDNWIDQGTTNKRIATVITSGGITSSAGALIARAVIELSGSRLMYTVVMASAAGNLAIAAGSTITLTLPGGQAMAVSDQCAGTIVDVTSGTINGTGVAGSAGNVVITIPVAVGATTHSIVANGTVFVA